MPSAPLRGTQDLLFDAANRLRRCERALEQVFARAGYAEAILPAIESAEVFGDDALRSQNARGELVALRSDFTAQVARVAATRLSGVSPLRLHYRGSIVRGLFEILQAGCELVGVPGVEGDAEIAGLALACLDALGLRGARISIGSTGYFAALTQGMPEAQALFAAVSRKDVPTLRALCASLPSGALRESLLSLSSPPRQGMEARGLLMRAQETAPTEAAREEVQRLRALLDRVRDERLEIDLGEVRGLGYYTGIVFNCYAPGASRAIGGGGRYDKLLERFGDGRPAVGFSLDLDECCALSGGAP